MVFHCQIARRFLPGMILWDHSCSWKTKPLHWVAEEAHPKRNVFWALSEGVGYISKMQNEKKWWLVMIIHWILGCPLRQTHIVDCLILMQSKAMLWDFQLGTVHIAVKGLAHFSIPAQHRIARAGCLPHSLRDLVATATLVAQLLVDHNFWTQMARPPWLHEPHIDWTHYHLLSLYIPFD